VNLSSGHKGAHRDGEGRRRCQQKSLFNGDRHDVLLSLVSLVSSTFLLNAPALIPAINRLSLSSPHLDPKMDRLGMANRSPWGGNVHIFRFFCDAYILFLAFWALFAMHTCFLRKGPKRIISAYVVFLSISFNLEAHRLDIRRGETIRGEEGLD